MHPILSSHTLRRPAQNVISLDLPKALESWAAKLPVSLQLYYRGLSNAKENCKKIGAREIAKIWINDVFNLLALLTEIFVQCSIRKI